MLLPGAGSSAHVTGMIQQQSPGGSVEQKAHQKVSHSAAMTTMKTWVAAINAMR